MLQRVPLEVTETQNGLRVRAEVPGFREEENDVRAEPRRIYISGERKEEPEPKKGENDLFRIGLQPRLPLVRGAR